MRLSLVTFVVTAYVHDVEGWLLDGLQRNKRGKSHLPVVTVNLSLTYTTIEGWRPVRAEAHHMSGSSSGVSKGDGEAG